MSRTILIVEDDQFIREAISDLLEMEGYNVLAAPNGQAGIDLMRASSAPPALVLLDLMMPVMDGFGFREEQLRDERLSATPVVIMSADGNVLEKSQRAKASAYLKKPVSLDDVVETVRKFAN